MITIYINRLNCIHTSMYTHINTNFKIPGVRHYTITFLIKNKLMVQFDLLHNSTVTNAVDAKNKRIDL